MTKEKIPRNNINIDIININDNIIKYQKKQSIKKYLNNKTQSNSETELIKENFILNAFTNKSLKKDKIKFINDKKINTNNNINNNDMKKINVKEMKEKYHNLLRGKKFTHGSYDTTNRLHLLKKFRALNNPLGNISNNIINNTITNTINSHKYKRSPLTKNNILSPNERNQNILKNYNKTPIKNKINKNNKDNIMENNNINNINNKDIVGNKYQYISNKKNKQLDINNKKMKFVKK